MQWIASLYAGDEPTQLGEIVVRLATEVWQPHGARLLVDDLAESQKVGQRLGGGEGPGGIVVLSLEGVCFLAEALEVVDAILEGVEERRADVGQCLGLIGHELQDLSIDDANERL